MRCPHCGSVVRLSVGASGPGKRVHTAMGPGLGDTPIPGDLPIVEMVPLAEATPEIGAPPWRRWAIVVTALLTLAAAVAMVIGVLVS